MCVIVQRGVYHSNVCQCSVDLLLVTLCVTLWMHLYFLQDGAQHTKEMCSVELYSLNTCTYCWAVVNDFSTLLSASSFTRHIVCFSVHRLHQLCMYWHSTCIMTLHMCVSVAACAMAFSVEVSQRLSHGELSSSSHYPLTSHHQSLITVGSAKYVITVMDRPA